MSSPLISVHVVAQEPARSAEPTLQSIALQTHAPLQVVLIDNASRDRETASFRFLGPETMVLRNFRDQGFSRAHNQGLASLYTRWPRETWSQRYIALLSSRAILSSATLQELVRVLEEDPMCMAVSPKVRRASLRIEEDVERPELVDAGIIEQVGMLFSSSLELYSRGRGEKDEGQYDQVSGDVLLGTWCVLIRASALMQAKVGDEWLDADLPEPYAMADLIWRLQTLGMSTRVVPSAIAWVQAASSTSLTLWSWIRSWYGQAASRERGMRGYVCILRAKNAPWGKIFLALPFLFVVWLRRIFQLLVDPRALPFVLGGWMKLPRALKKRRFLQLAISQSRR